MAVLLVAAARIAGPLATGSRLFRLEHTLQHCRLDFFMILENSERLE